MDLKLRDALMDRIEAEAADLNRLMDQLLAEMEAAQADDPRRGGGADFAKRFIDLAKRQADLALRLTIAAGAIESAEKPKRPN
jgi:hypothetical protein